MLNKIRNKLSYKKYSPLIYNDELRESYLGNSVTGNSLSNKTILITGGTGDIGISLALRFIDENCKVIISGRNNKKLKSTSKFLMEKRQNADVSVLSMDLMELKSIEKIIDNLYANDIKIDILISNAGFFGENDRKAVFRNYNLDDYIISWNTNFQGNASVCKCVAKKMSENNIDGSIIVISSICAQQKKMQYTPYGMSKSAIRSYAQLLQKNFPSLNIMTICPGSVATKMGNITIGDNIARNVNKLNHIALPEEISALAAFLCSETGRYLKGAEITASGCEIF